MQIYIGTLRPIQPNAGCALSLSLPPSRPASLRVRPSATAICNLNPGMQGGWASRSARSPRPADRWQDSKTWRDLHLALAMNAKLPK